MNKVKIGDLLTRIKESIDIEDDKQYKRVTIKTNNKGVYLRNIEFGRNIGTKKQFIIHAGQFLLSKIDARNGAFGIVPNELDGAIITGNFWTYEVNHELLNIEWFNLFVSSPEFIDICDRASSGTTNRRYLDENKFLNFVISLPSIDEQCAFMEYFKNIKQKYDTIMIELRYQQDLFTKLRQSILQEAVQGKLVPQDPDDEPASVLLERIKEEKERLIKEKKIKKQKPLPPITEDEIPYELPKGWEWVRLINIAKVIEYGTSSKASNVNIGVPVLRMNNIQNGKIVFSDLKYVSNNIKDLPRLYLKKSDLLFNRTNSYELVGKTGVYLKEDDVFTFASYLIRISLFNEFIDARFINYYMNSLIYRQTQIEPEITQQNGQANYNGTKLKNTIMPIPPLNEQKRIVQKVDQLMALCNELEKNIEQSKKDSELLMQSVLQEAFKES